MSDSAVSVECDENTALNKKWKCNVWYSNTVFINFLVVRGAKSIYNTKFKPALLTARMVTKKLSACTACLDLLKCHAVYGTKTKPKLTCFPQTEFYTEEYFASIKYIFWLIMSFQF